MLWPTAAIVARLIHVFWRRKATFAPEICITICIDKSLTPKFGDSILLHFSRPH